MGDDCATFVPVFLGFQVNNAIEQVELGGVERLVGRVEV